MIAKHEAGLSKDEISQILGLLITYFYSVFLSAACMHAVSACVCRQLDVVLNILRFLFAQGPNYKLAIHDRGGSRFPVGDRQLTDTHGRRHLAAGTQHETSRFGEAPAAVHALPDLDRATGVRSADSVRAATVRAARVAVRLRTLIQAPLELCLQTASR